jgi:hypothetical protein
MSLTVKHDPGAYCTRMREFTYRLEWLPEKHYPAGSQIELRTERLRAFVHWRFTRFSMKAGNITFRWKSQPSVSEYRTNPGRVLLRASLPYGARKARGIEIEITAVPAYWAGIHNALSVWTIDIPNNFAPDAPAPSAQLEEGSRCELTVVAGPVERFSVYSRPFPGKDGNVRTVLVPEDRFGNPGIFTAPVECELTWNGTARSILVQQTTETQLSEPNGVGRALLSIPMQALSPKENIANGRREGDRLLVTGNPVWSEAPLDRRPAFGEFHWHTDFSGDGQRPIAEALRCARDYLNMDYAAPGDHNPQGDDWKQTVEALEAANEDDVFATFFGWENGTDRGHENYYFTSPDHPLVCGGSAGIVQGRPETLIEKLNKVSQECDFIGVPHHTNAVAETRKLEDDSPYWHPYPWNEPQDYLRLVEIMQCRGNQEREEYDDAWRGWHQNNKASVQEALALGHRLGFAGGTDNHCGWPGRAFAESEGTNHPIKSVILTGVWTPWVERQSVFEALKQRHTWAVWDTRAIVWFTINGAQAGDVLEADADVELVGHLRLSSEDSLQTVEVVSDGKVVWQQSFDDLDIELDLRLGQVRTSTYFYLRALQRDGGIIYASPVFVQVKTMDPHEESI